MIYKWRGWKSLIWGLPKCAFVFLCVYVNIYLLLGWLHINITIMLNTILSSACAEFWIYGSRLASVPLLTTVLLCFFFSFILYSSASLCFHHFAWGRMSVSNHSYDILLLYISFYEWPVVVINYNLLDQEIFHYDHAWKKRDYIKWSEWWIESLLAMRCALRVDCLLVCAFLIGWIAGCDFLNFA